MMETNPFCDEVEQLSDGMLS